MRVEWVFSVPTTWRNAAFIHNIEAAIRSTGFGTDGNAHSCRITLTEAEAAGICVASQYLDVRISVSRPERGRMSDLE